MSLPRLRLALVVGLVLQLGAGACSLGWSAASLCVGSAFLSTKCMIPCPAIGIANVSEESDTEKFRTIEDKGRL